MGRPRSFDQRAVVHAAGELFARRGYAATSIDDLVSATGVHRGSLYQAFGSKRGLFLAALAALLDGTLLDGTLLDETLPHTAVAGVPALVRTCALDLVLVAALELAPDDDDARALVRRAGAHLTSHSIAELYGRRLLRRAGLSSDPPHEG